MLGESLDGPVLARRIPPFEDDEDLLVFPDEMSLEFDELDLEVAQFLMVCG